VNFEYQEESVLLLINNKDEINILSEIPYFSSLFNYYSTIGKDVKCIEIYFIDFIWNNFIEETTISK